jgi:hypothetical protein
MQRWYVFSFLVVNPALVMLGCFWLFVRCSVVEKTSRATGMATETTHGPVADFIERSRPKKLEYRPLYRNEERESHGSDKKLPSENTEAFKDLELDLEQQLNRINTP